jgi:hypothetical protein
MGELTVLAEKLRSDPRVAKTRFSSAFLEDVGNILERRGFSEARLFVWENRDRGDLGPQVQPMLIILDELEKVPVIEEDKALGCYIIKNKLRLLVDGIVEGRR